MMQMLADTAVPIRQKISALWASVMFCYVYGDFFGLFTAGKLARMNAGLILPIGPATPNVLLGVSVMMAIPSLMVGLTLVLPATLSRWANIVLGVAYTAIILITMPGAPRFYVFFGIIEATLTLAIVACAWAWPKRSGAAQ
jgi:Family of unknown function (DUF6326)